MMRHVRVDAKYDQKKKLGELNELAVCWPYCYSREDEMR